MRAPAFQLLALAVATGSSLAQNYYESGYDHLAGSPSGTPLAGREGYFAPSTTPSSSDGAIYSYVGNALQLPVLVDGGTSFLGLDASSGPAQVERVSNIPFDCQVHIEFDFCVHYAGSTAPAGVIGGFSLQPESTAVTMNLLARWPANATFPPTTWNADVVIGTSTGNIAVQVPDSRFQNLAVDHWYRWGCSVHVVHSEYTLLVLDDLAGSRVLFVPPPNAMMNPLGAPPTAFRLSALGSGCRLGFDRVSVAYHGTFTLFGAGCAGSLGVPLLQDFQSRAAIGGTFQMSLSGLPLNVGAIGYGFSNTLWGSVPLPADLTGAGLPGCFLLVDPVQIDLVFGSGGSATWGMFLPDGAGLMGLEFYAQGASLDPAANAAGIVMSNAGHGCIGR